MKATSHDSKTSGFPDSPTSRGTKRRGAALPEEQVSLAVADGMPITETGQLEIDFYSDAVKRLYPDTAASYTLSQGASIEREVIRQLVREPMRMLHSLTHLTLPQRRVYWMVLYSVKNHQYRYKKENDPLYGSMAFHFHVSDIVQGEGNISTHYMKKLVNDLQSIKIHWPADGSNGSSIVVFPVAHYATGKRMIILHLSPHLIPGFLELGNNFSQYQLDAAMKLTSQYAQLLYTHLCRHIWRGVWSVSMDELRRFLGCDTNDKYEEYSNFRIRVLDPSVKQLTEHCQLAISYKAIRNGRRVERIDFTIRHLNDPEVIGAERRLRLEEYTATVDTWDPAQKRQFVQDTIRSYYPGITTGQRQQILSSDELVERFCRADAYISAGHVANSAHLNYLLKSVFNPAPASLTLSNKKA